MNIFTVNTGANAHNNYKSSSVFAGNLPILHNSTLKSTQEKMERQQQAGNQIQFWEKQKENLKNMECGTVEEIAKKLEMFHNYEDEITAVKTAYNNEQMSHILDEAEEQGKKNAKAAEKLEPKTPEERREEMLEEAQGTEEDKGALEEVMEEMTEMVEETQEQLLEETQEQLKEVQEEQIDSVSEQLEAQKKNIEESAKELKELYDIYKEDWKKLYKGVDIKV
ncbi:MAG: hypothetical protein K1V96_00685 [Lachnospiraceae bacterium]